ncbi:MAG: hypothetical protein Q8P97_00530 [bacterium]|nr:hypothetical protein [bacterium]
MAKKLLKHSSDHDREAAAELVLRHERKSLSDIVPSKKHNVISFVEEEGKKSLTRVKDEEDLADEGARADEEDSEWVPFFSGNRLERFSYAKWVVFASVLLLFIAGIYIALFVLPKADISLTLKTSSWPESGPFSGDISAMLSGGDVSAQLQSHEKNLPQLPLIATGKKLIKSKATGTIKIYNAFSSDPQPLVATTRFLSPDGKIFRLDKSVTVPGAKITDGKITPSSVDAAVSADNIGSEYNIGSVSRWSIPGFKGSPKYDSFYGVSDTPMAGGANGEQGYPTDKDIAAAKKDAEQKIRDDLGALFAIDIQTDLTMLDGSSNFKIVKSQPILTPDASGKYFYFIQAKEDRLAIRKEDILNLMVSKAVADKAVKEPGADFTAKKTDLKFDFKSLVIGKDGAVKGATMAVIFQGDFVRKVDINDLRGQVAGKNENDLKALILSDLRIESAKIALWPFWVKKVPGNQAKITISAE